MLIPSLQREADWAQRRGCQSAPSLDTGQWPFGLEVVVHAFKVAKEGRLLPLFTEIIETTGNTFQQHVLGFRSVNTIDPLNVEAILSTQFHGGRTTSRCPKRGDLTKPSLEFGLGERRLVFLPLLGDGIFTQDGRAWEHSRALLRPVFQQNREQIFQNVAEEADALLRIIPRGQIVDLQPLFFRYTLDTTTFILFGESLGALNDVRDDAAASFAAAFDEGQDYLAQRGRLGALHWTIDGWRFRRVCGKVHRYIDRLVANAVKRQNAIDQKLPYTILGGLLDQNQTPRMLREHCLNVLLAGRDTTACLLTWTFRLLAGHETVYRALRAEVVDICGVHSKPSRNDIKQMRYLDAVLKEVLRLYPSVPVNARMANITTTMPAGGGPDGTSPVLVHQGESVVYSAYAMHRRKDLFGQDACDFRPERWLDNDGRLFTTAGYAYLPFNAGPRVCLGQEFALFEASFVIIRVLQEFDGLSIPVAEHIQAPGDERQKLTLVLSCAEGCRVVLGTATP